jgi:hypothetical protein
MPTMIWGSSAWITTWLKSVRRDTPKFSAS